MENLRCRQEERKQGGMEGERGSSGGVLVRREETVGQGGGGLMEEDRWRWAGGLMEKVRVVVEV